jgi:DNA-binding transcriptional ArsR family regulator
MFPQANLAAVASLVAEPARAAMLMSLFDGRARPAGELAYAAGVTPQTASSHLAKLLDGGLLSVEAAGRHRYFRLAGAHVAQALELLAMVAPAAPVRARPLSRDARELRHARCCYDHLAGRLGVAVAQALVSRKFLVAEADQLFAVTPAGREWLATLGIDLAALRPTRRGLARQCLDWTERTHHLAGPLGRQLLTSLCDAGWLRRSPASRSVQVTPKGILAFRQQLGVDASPGADQLAA